MLKYEDKKPDKVIKGLDALKEKAAAKAKAEGGPELSLISIAEKLARNRAKRKR